VLGRLGRHLLEAAALVQGGEQRRLCGRGKRGRERSRRRPNGLLKFRRQAIHDHGHRDRCGSASRRRWYLGRSCFVEVTEAIVVAVVALAGASTRRRRRRRIFEITKSIIFFFFRRRCVASPCLVEVAEAIVAITLGIVAAFGI
jgi:hypothetical protein